MITILIQKPWRTGNFNLEYKPHAFLTEFHQPNIPSHSNLEGKGHCSDVQPSGKSLRHYYLKSDVDGGDNDKH